MEQVLKMSATKKGKRLSPEMVVRMSAWLKGIKKSPEHCAKIAAAKLGNKHGAKAYIGVSPTGDVYEFFNATDFVEEHKEYKLTRIGIYKCAGGQRKTHQGWEFYHAENYYESAA